MLSVQPPQHNFELSINIVLAGIIVISILLIILIRRNNQVLKYRMYIINLISKRDMEEILKGMSYTGSRLKMFSQVSYYKMLLKFWKPLDSFFDLNNILEIKGGSYYHDSHNN
jgi:hypothetical protein